MLHQYLVPNFYHLIISFSTDIKFNTLVITGFEIVVFKMRQSNQLKQKYCKGLKKASKLCPGRFS